MKGAGSRDVKGKSVPEEACSPRGATRNSIFPMRSAASLPNKVSPRSERIDRVG